MGSWRDDLNYGLAAFGLKLPERLSLHDLTAHLDTAPGKSIAQVIAAGSVLFFLAERRHNPAVRSVFDAAVYCAACLSVGDSGIFPTTPAGKMIGTLLMTYGPSLAQRALDRPARADSGLPSGDDTQQQILQTLRSILERLPTPDTTAR